MRTDKLTNGEFAVSEARALCRVSILTRTSSLSVLVCPAKSAEGRSGRRVRSVGFGAAAVG